MRSEPIPLPGDFDEPPFSNSTDAHYWIESYCAAGGGCIHDTMYGQEAPDGDEIHCPLITLSMLGVWPQEWAREDHHWQIGDKEGTYKVAGACSEYTDEQPTADEPPVVAVNLFGQYDIEPAGGS